ncbi:hypothetical protein D1007_13548 [Hordeum vulgare]|nr:hypothetical protein D1007_13548 [Hordeum vulgare]
MVGSPTFWICLVATEFLPYLDVRFSDDRRGRKSEGLTLLASSGFPDVVGHPGSGHPRTTRRPNRSRPTNKIERVELPRVFSKFLARPSDPLLINSVGSLKLKNRKRYTLHS